MQTWDNKGVHNFSIGTLCSYFYLHDNLATGKAIVLDGVLHLSIYGHKTFVFFNGDRYREELSRFQRLGPLYSIDALDLPGKSKFKEVLYDLSVVFDDESYPNTDKRKKRLRAPFKKFNDWGISSEIITKDNLPEIKILHDKWVDYKLANPKTFKIMFSKTRYFRCCVLCAEQHSSGRKMLFAYDDGPGNKADYVGTLYRIKEKPVGVLVSSIKNDYAYSLAGFTNTWDAPSQMSEILQIHFMRELFRQGIKFINDGASLNSSLKSFKGHYPHSIKVSFQYARQKE